MFISRLKELRKDKGYTQRDLALLLNGTPNKVASWEQGRTEPSIRDIVYLCKLFDVSADYLLGIKDY